MKISFRQTGNFSKTVRFLTNTKKQTYLRNLDRFGREGVAALSRATPVDTGKTADSWSYEITQGKGYAVLSFLNKNIQNGVPIAIILQYGHATKNGGWIEGRDYINPAIRPVFDKIAEEAWKEVKRS